tara:strand:+ start:380 stop:682 length:303 start_codon:yes stop_codon:yes gene_type:complete
MGNRENTIKNLLLSEFSPSVLKIVNESYMHNVPEGSESHFKLVIVSDEFKNLSNVKRHQEVYKVLSEVMKSIHALSIHSFDNEEYKNNPMILDSPNCVNK